MVDCKLDWHLGSFGTMGMNLELVTGVVDCLDIRTEIQQN